MAQASAPVQAAASLDATMLRALHRDLDLLDADADASANADGVTDGTGGGSLLSRLDTTRLVGGRAQLAALLSGPPIVDAGALRARQAALLRLRHVLTDEKKDESSRTQSQEQQTHARDGDAHRHHDHHRNVLLNDGHGQTATHDANTHEHELEYEDMTRDGEGDVEWLVRCQSDDVLRAHVRTALYGTWPLTLLNKRSPVALTALFGYRVAVSPAVSLLTPLVVYVIMPWLVLSFHARRMVPLGQTLAAAAKEWCRAARGVLARLFSTQGFLQGLSALLSLVVYVHGVFSSVASAIATLGVVRELQQRVDGARRFATGARRIARRLLRDATTAGALATWFDDGDGDRRRSARALDDLHAAAAWRFGGVRVGAAAGRALQQQAASQEGRRVGDRLRDVAAFDAAAAAAALRTAWRVDAIRSVLRLLCAPHGGWSLAEYSDSAAAPLLEMRGVWHPALPAENAVRNDWRLGARFGAPHALVTGPNAGGKSTLMKAALCCVLLAQTLTIVPCAHGCALTPFAVISSHMRAADVTGCQSLFEAEMARAQRALDVLRVGHLGSGGPPAALVVVDEMFSSTNVVEGTAAAAACAAQFARMPSVLSVVSTHHLQLADALSMLCPGRFACFGMPVRVSDAPHRRIARPFRLSQALCRQHVAIELLRSAGFDAGLVQDALRVKAWVLRPAARRPAVEASKRSGKRRGANSARLPRPVQEARDVPAPAPAAAPDVEAPAAPDAAAAALASSS